MKGVKECLRVAAIGAVLLAGSCASPEDSHWTSSDGAVNNPITVAPQFASIRVNFSAPQAGLLPDDSARFEAFVADYLSRGSGSISVSAPQNGDSTAALSYFGGRLFAMGVPKSKILVGTHAGNNAGVELKFIAYTAQTNPCGTWDRNLAFTYSNRTPENFGCAVQQNIAAQVADPRDLIEMRPTDPSDAARRATVIDNYEKGRVTAAEKTKDQSGAVSEVKKD